MTPHQLPAGHNATSLSPGLRAWGFSFHEFVLHDQEVSRHV